MNAPTSKKLPILGFFGSPKLAACCLTRLLATFPVGMVVTQPDKSAGRGRVLGATEVAQVAERAKLPLYKPPALRHEASARALADGLKAHGVELIVVVAYGKLLPDEILQAPMLGCVNLHASILPKYRGAAPVQAALMAGERITGITVQKMKREMDAGDILATREIGIDPGWTAEHLAGEINRIAPAFLGETIEAYLSGGISPVPQDEREATFCSIIRKEDGAIDWNDEAARICNKVRAYNIWPVCYSYLDGKLVRFFAARIARGETENAHATPGQVVRLDKGEGIVTMAGDGLVGLLELQLENKKRLSHRDFVNGCRDLLGRRFSAQQQTS